MFAVSVAKFCLNSRFRREFHLEKAVGYRIALISVGAKAICLEMEAAEAKRSLIVNPREHAFACIRLVLASEASRLKINPIAVEERMEFVE